MKFTLDKRSLHNRYHDMRKMISLLLVAMMFCYTGCGITEEAMNGGTTEKELTVKSNEVTDPVARDTYAIYTGGLRGMKALAKPEFYFPKNSIYKYSEATPDEDSSWEDKEGNYLFVEPGSVSYSTEEYYKIYADILNDEQGDLRRDFDEVLEEAEIHGITKQKALEKVNSLVKKMDVEVSDMKAYPLSKENLTTLSKLFMSDEEYIEYMRDPTNEPMKREFDKNDEAYLVVMNLSIHGNLLYDKDYDYGERCYLGSYGMAIVKPDGFVAVLINGIYDVEEVVSHEAKAIPLEQAKEMMKQKFENIISYDEVECEEIQQRYVATNNGKGKEVSFVPAYVFQLNQTITSVKEGKSDSVEVGSTLLLDMENGKWIE